MYLTQRSRFEVEKHPSSNGAIPAVGTTRTFSFTRKTYVRGSGASSGFSRENDQHFFSFDPALPAIGIFDFDPGVLRLVVQQAEFNAVLHSVKSGRYIQRPVVDGGV